MNSRFSKDGVQMAKKHEKVLRNANSNYAEISTRLEQTMAVAQKDAAEGAPIYFWWEHN